MINEIRLKKICEEALKISFKNVTISEFRTMSTNRFDVEKNEWIYDSEVLFIGLKKQPINYEDKNYNYLHDIESYHEIESLLEGLLGFTCCVNFI